MSQLEQIPSTAARFVILWHEVLPIRQGTPAIAIGRTTESHYDLMFEVGDSLRTWATSNWPLPIGKALPATELAPHRRHYLDYEGPISANRGTVQRVAAGRYLVLDDLPGVFQVRWETDTDRGCLLFTGGQVTAVPPTPASDD
ncbi:hypothetical protein SH139x_003551 [Planctomycetaceae bacterium SH139]